MISPEETWRMLAKRHRFGPRRLGTTGRIFAIRLLEDDAFFPVKIAETSGEDALPDIAHELVIKMDVVLAEKLPAERLARFREVMEVGAGIARTGRAIAGRIERLVREFVNPAAHLEKTARCEDGAALRQLRRHDAIKHVDPAMDGFEDVERSADAHQVTRLVCRQKRGGEFADLFALDFALADREAADGETIEGHFA